MSLCSCYDHALSQEQSDKSPSESVCQPVTPRDDIESPFQHSPLSYYESQSLQSDDYMDPPWAVPGRADRLVSTQSITLDPIKLRRELSLMAILHEYPMSMVHHIGFKDYLSNLNPSFGMVSQETVKNDIMKIRKFERSIAVSELGSPYSGRVAITTKMWTSSDGNRKFVAITGHMVDFQWDKRSYIMRFANVPNVGTNESLAKILLECFSEFDVDVKLSTITMDNQTSDDELANILIDKLPGKKLIMGGKLFRLPCFAHTLRLMVQDGFDVVSHVIEKIRDSIVFWTASKEREEGFKQAARNCGISPTVTLMLDYDSKWSSTYLMMQEALKHKDIFVNLRQRESQYKAFPTEEEWSLAIEVCQRLKVLYQLMKGIEEQPVACHYCIWICYVKVRLSKWQDCEVMEIKEMASQMLNKFDKYWSEARDFLCIAAVFHPKYRFFTLNHYFPKIYGSEAENESERISKMCYDLYDEYKSSMLAEKTDEGEQTDDEGEQTDEGEHPTKTDLRHVKPMLNLFAYSLSVFATKCTIFAYCHGA